MGPCIPTFFLWIVTTSTLYRRAAFEEPSLTPAQERIDCAKFAQDPLFSFWSGFSSSCLNMHRALTARWIGRAFNTTEIVGQAGVPLFLCPALAAGRTGVVRPWSGSAPSPGQSKRTIGLCQRRSNHSAAIASDPQPDAAPLSTAEYAHEVESKLPINCSGCGAFSQTTDPDQFGYFTPDSKRVRNYVFRHEKAERRKQSAEAEEDKVVEDVIKTLDPSRLKELGLSPELLQVNSEVQETEENGKKLRCGRDA